MNWWSRAFVTLLCLLVAFPCLGLRKLLSYFTCYSISLFSEIQPINPLRITVILIKSTILLFTLALNLTQTIWRTLIIHSLLLNAYIILQGYKVTSCTQTMLNSFFIILKHEWCFDVILQSNWSGLAMKLFTRSLPHIGNSFTCWAGVTDLRVYICISKWRVLLLLAYFNGLVLPQT